MKLFRQVMRLVLLLVFISTTVMAEECLIPGQAEHWVIDYCLWINESDDFDQPSVQECYDEEKANVPFQQECKAKEYFKQKICDAHAYYEENFDAGKCFSNEDFIGPTVSNGGVKKIVVKDVDVPFSEDNILENVIDSE